MESAARIINSTTINDIFYFGLHLLLIFVVVYGLYDQIVKAPLHHRLTILTNKIKRGTKIASEQILYWFANQIETARRRINKLRGIHNQNVTLPVTSIVGVTTHPPSIKVTRGEASWTYFGLAWTILSVLFIEANGQYEVIKNLSISVGIVTLDVIIITWLCFYCRWFRNKIIGIVNHRNITPD